MVIADFLRDAKRRSVLSLCLVTRLVARLVLRLDVHEVDPRAIRRDDGGLEPLATHPHRRRRLADVPHANLATKRKRRRSVPRVEPQHDDAASTAGGRRRRRRRREHRVRPRERDGVHARARGRRRPRARQAGGGRHHLAARRFKLFQLAAYPLGDVRGRRHHLAVGAGAHQQNPSVRAEAHGVIGGPRGGGDRSGGDARRSRVEIDNARRQLIPRALDGVDRRRRVGAQRTFRFVRDE